MLSVKHIRHYNGLHSSHSIHILVRFKAYFQISALNNLYLIFYNLEKYFDVPMVNPDNFGKSRNVLYFYQPVDHFFFFGDTLEKLKSPTKDRELV